MIILLSSQNPYCPGSLLYLRCGLVFCMNYGFFYYLLQSPSHQNAHARVKYQNSTCQDNKIADPFASNISINLQGNTNQQQMSELQKLQLVLLIILASSVTVHGFELFISRVTLTQSVTTVSIPFDNDFSEVPQFGYAAETVSVAQPEFAVDYTLQGSAISRFTIKFMLSTRGNAAWNVNDLVQIVCIFAWEPNSRVEIGTFQFTDLAVDVPYQSEHKYNSLVSYSLDVFACTFPLVFGIPSKQSNQFSLLVTSTPNPTLSIRISYVLVEKIFISQNIFVVFNQFQENIRDFVIMVDDYGYLRPSGDNTLLGIRQLAYTSGSITLTKMIVYSYKDPAMNNKLSMKAGYLASTSVISKLQSSYLNFNPEYSACLSIVSSASYLTYAVPFLTVPQDCGICNETCLTCTSSEDDSTYTDSRFCTSCPPQRYLSYLSNGSFGFGSCLCLEGLEVDSNGNCQLCEYNCLSFNVYLIRSSSIAVFLLTFTEGNLNYVLNFEDNLQISVDGLKIKYNSTMISSGAFRITLQSTDLVSCQKSCNVLFYFKSPSSIRAVTDSKPLTTQQQIVKISDFYVIEARLPPELSKAFLISGMIVSASSASGQAGFIKMLFELQQVIEIHKYLNLELPVVFKQFIQALSSFRFMDFTTILQVDVNEKVRQLSGSSLDCKGEFKIVYYENGANFYKNMVSVIVSTLIILSTNFIIFLFLKALPFKFTTGLSQKIKLRWPISLSELVQTLVIPISLFATFQLSYTVLGYSYIWVYALAYLFSAFVLFYPFYCISMIVTIRSRATDDKDMKNYKKQQLRIKRAMQNNVKAKDNNKFDIHSKLHEIDLEIIEDLLQDSKISKAAYVLYVFGFLKKFMFGIMLGTNLPGLLQLMLMLCLNILHALIILYIVVQNLYMSKVKTLTRIINLICLITLESLILSYHLAYHSIEDRILIGVTCTYLALITTAIGIIQLFIKLGQIVYQKLKANQEQGMSSKQKYKATDDFIVNANGHVVQCKIQRANKTVAVLVNDSDEQHNSNRNNEKEYSEDDEDDIIHDRIKRKRQFEKFKQLQKQRREKRRKQAELLINRNNVVDPDGSEWSRFSEYDDNPNKNTIQYEDKSQSSDIVAIDSKELIAWVPPVKINKDFELPKRLNSHERKLRYQNANKNADDRKKTASTQGEIHTITSAKLQNNIRTLDSQNSNDKGTITIDRRNSKTKGDRQIGKQVQTQNNRLVVQNTKRKLIDFQNESSMSDIVQIQQSK